MSDIVYYINIQITFFLPYSPNVHELFYPRSFILIKYLINVPSTFFLLYKYFSFVDTYLFNVIQSINIVYDFIMNY